MHARTYCRVSAALFAVVALAHFSRIMNGWTLEVESIQIPMLVSWIGLIVPAALAIWGFREARGDHT